MSLEVWLPLVLSSPLLLWLLKAFQRRLWARNRAHFELTPAVDEIRKQVTPSNGIPAAQILEQLADDLRADRAALVAHLSDAKRHL